MNSFAKLNDGTWGIRVQGPVAVGDRVQVTRKDGSTSLQTVTRVKWTDRFGVTVCEIAANRPATPYSQRGVYGPDGHWETDGDY